MPDESRSSNEDAAETESHEATVTEIADVDELEVALPGAQFGFSRIDRGTGVTPISSRGYGGVASHQLDFGFSVLGDGALDHSTLLLVALTKAGPRPTISDGAVQTFGSVTVSGPGAAAHGVWADGSRLKVLRVDYESLRETADVIGVDIGDWENRRECLGASGWQGRSILAVGSELDPNGDGSALLSSVALTLSSASLEVVPRRNASSKEIVGRSFECLDVTGSWFPPIADLCRSVGASERRLRQAFVDCFDRPPSEVLRTRALSAVRHVLQHSSPQDTEVSAVAASHGFRHFGDFGRYYRAAFGETPSQTLRTTA